MNADDKQLELATAHEKALTALRAAMNMLNEDTYTIDEVLNLLSITYDYIERAQSLT